MSTVGVDDPYAWLAKDPSDPKIVEWLKKQDDALTSLGDDSEVVLKELRDCDRAIPTNPPIEIDGARYWCTDGRLKKITKDQTEPDVILNLYDIENAYGYDGLVKSWFVSPQGNYIALTMSEKGQDDVEIIVYDLNTKKQCSDKIPLGLWISSVAWKADESGFFYPWADTNSRPEDRCVYWHKLGTSQDEPITDSLYFSGEISIKMSGDCEWLMATSILFPDSTHRMAAMHIDTGEIRICAEHLKTLSMSYILDDTVYILTSDMAGGNRLLATPFCKNMPPLSDWKEVIPEGDSTLNGLYFAARGIVALYQHARTGDALSMFDYDGNLVDEIDIPEMCRVTFNDSPNPKSETFWFLVMGMTTSKTRYCYNMVDKSLRVDKTFSSRCLNKYDYVITHHVAKGDDGTLVPVTTIHHRLVRIEEDNPVMLGGYGGFNKVPPLVREAYYLPLLRRGVILAFATLRGDGGMGRKWSNDGRGCKHKMNTFADFIAAAKFLKTHYTRTKLAAFGCSNGGLTVAAACIMEPDLFRAVSLKFPVIDMGNITNWAHTSDYTYDYGNPSDPAQWKDMQRWCPYFNLDADTVYPPHIIFHSPDDQRVLPSNGWKYAAKLQANSDNTALVVAVPSVGHVQTFSSLALEMAFVARQLGVKI